MDKKGMVTTLRDLLLILVVMAVLFAFSSTLWKVLRPVANDNICLMSLLGSHYKNMEVTCDVNDIKFYTNHVENNQEDASVYLKDGSDVKRFDESDENFKYAVYYTIAEEMKRCWENIGQGKANILPSDLSLVNFVSPTVVLSSYCLLCADIRFDENVPYEKLGGLMNYLKSTRIRETKYDGQTYWEFLNKDNKAGQILWWGWGDVSSLKDFQNMEIDTDNEYYLYANIGTPNFADSWILGAEGKYHMLLFPKNTLDCKLIVN